MSVTVSGGDKLKARLDRIRGRVFVSGDTDLLRMWGLTAEALAKALAPVDTGFLRSHIRYTRLSETTAQVGVAGVDYCRYVEYGTASLLATHGFLVTEGYGGYQPYLRPGCAAAYREMVIKIKAYLASR
jgi:hypothetical protein